MIFLKTNLVFLRKQKGLKQSDMQVIGFKRTTWNNYESGVSEPNFESIKIISDFFKVKIDDLLSLDFSENASLSDDLMVMENEAEYKPNVKPKYKPNDLKQGIPLIPVEAMAGMTNGDSQVTENDILKRYIVPEFTELGVNFIIQAKGSSMLPKYNSGDLLACKKIKDLTFFQWGKVYVLDTDQGALVKRLYASKIEGSVECHSDNKDRYPPFEILKTSIRSIAIVLGVIRLE